MGFKMLRNSKGQILEGNVPHNKRDFIVCRISGCDRTDHKARGYCEKHYTLLNNRKRNGYPYDDVSLSKRLPRTEEHIRNNLAYIKSPGYVSPLKGKTYKEIYGDKYKEHCEKHRKSLLGINKGRTSPIKGIKTGRPAWNKGMPYCQKEKNPFWRGGSSREKYGHQFTYRLKEKIRNRDQRKCVCCGCPEKELTKKLCVHHIDENKKNNKENNLISLCPDCHIKVHWSKDDWARFLRRRIKEYKEVCRG